MTRSNLVWLMLLTGCMAKLPLVEPLSADSGPDVLVYTLPQTGFVVSIKGHVDEGVGTPRCLAHLEMVADYGLKPTKTTGKVLSMSGKATLTATSSPDPQAQFAVALPGKGVDMVSLTRTPASVPTAAASAASSPIEDIALFSAEILGTTLGAFFGTRTTMQAVEADPTEVFCRAKAAEIGQLLKQKRTLSSNAGAADTMEVRTAKLAATDALIAAAKAPFSGLTVGSTKSITCRVVPRESAGPIALFTYSGKAGVTVAEGVDCDVPSGFVLGTDNALAQRSWAAGGDGWDGQAGRVVAEAAVTHTVELRVEELGLTPYSGDAEVPTTTGERSFHYRQPALANVGVHRTSSGKEAALTSTTTHAVAQLGAILSLPRMKSTGSVAVEVGFDEATGALTVVKATKADADYVAAVKAAHEAREAYDPGDPELAEAERTATLLGYQAAIVEAEQSLNGSE